MKSLFIVISILLFKSFDLSFSYAETQNKNYARILEDKVYLYSLPNEDSENILFELPKTYFVELISQYDNSFYKIKYIDITGYVKIDQVTPVSTTPQVPFLENITFRVYSSDGINVRTEPHTKNGLETIKGSLTVLDENVFYYGKVVGEEVVKNRGNTWYYCKYKTNKETIYGYVYAGFCDMLTTINNNNETLEYTNNPFFITQSEIINNHLTSNNNIKNLIIILTIIPTIVFLFLLFKPYKIINAENKKKINTLIKPKKHKRNNYYYDDYEI